jgi:hypothetical protein
MGMRLVRRSLLEYFAGLGLSSTLLDPGVGRAIREGDPQP